MSDSFNILFNGYLPAKDAPFFDELKEMFCPGMKTAILASDKDPVDLAIHCPNVVRAVEDIIKRHGRNFISDPDEKTTKSLKKGAIKEEIISKAEEAISQRMELIKDCLEIPKKDENSEVEEKVISLLKIAALYHDIGKKIRSANHPRLGINILRHSNENAKTKLINCLAIDAKENQKAKDHRFSLVCSIVEHHDKFGVVSTGEASLAIFSDILYFRSDKNAEQGIKKNITAVMLVNLADIAAVCKTDIDKKIKITAQELVYKILENKTTDNKGNYKKLLDICKNKDLFLGLNVDKITNILDDWNDLVESTEIVDWDRTKLREYLIRLDQNPYRTIKRIIRLIKECCYTTNCDPLLISVSETDVESTLISFFGSHQFQDFCLKFAYVAKMDYGLKFFKGIVCRCVRNETNTESTEKDGWLKLNGVEQKKLKSWPNEKKQAIINKVSKIFIQVISEIIRRYNSMFELKLESAYRLGLQMRNLTEDAKVREDILDYLCVKDDKEHVALTWIADEVTFWSMD